MKTIFYFQDTGKIHSIVYRKVRLSSEMRKLGLCVKYWDGAMPQGFRNVNNSRITNDGKIIPSKRKYSSIRIPSITNDEITLIRSHKSIGDAVSLLSGIQDLYERGIKVYLQIHENSYPLFLNHPAIYQLQHLDDEILTDAAINLSKPCPCGEYESHNENPRLSRNEIFALSMGSNNVQKPKLHLTDDEVEKGKLFTTNNLGIVLRSADIWKDWRHTLDFIRLAKEKYNVYTIDMKKEIKGVYNIINHTIREVMAKLIWLDCVVAPDTGIMHLCEALDVPCIALFGSMRTDRYLNRPFKSSITFLQGKCDKDPCMYNYCKGKGNYQPCMDWFTPGFILGKVKIKISGYKQIKLYE